MARSCFRVLISLVTLSSFELVAQNSNVHAESMGALAGEDRKFYLAETLLRAVVKGNVPNTRFLLETVKVDPIDLLIFNGADAEAARSLLGQKEFPEVVKFLEKHLNTRHKNSAKTGSLNVRTQRSPREHPCEIF